MGLYCNSAGKRLDFMQFRMTKKGSYLPRAEQVA